MEKFRLSIWRQCHERIYSRSNLNPQYYQSPRVSELIDLACFVDPRFKAICHSWVPKRLKIYMKYVSVQFKFHTYAYCFCPVNSVDVLLFLFLFCKSYNCFSLTDLKSVSDAVDKFFRNLTIWVEKTSLLAKWSCPLHLSMLKNFFANDQFLYIIEPTCKYTFLHVYT